MFAKDYQFMFPKNIQNKFKSFSNQGKGERELKDIAKKRAENWAKHIVVFLLGTGDGEQGNRESDDL